MLWLLALQFSLGLHFTIPFGTLWRRSASEATCIRDRGNIGSEDLVCMRKWRAIRESSCWAILEERAGMYLQGCRFSNSLLVIVVIFYILQLFKSLVLNMNIRCYFGLLWMLWFGIKPIGCNWIGRWCHSYIIIPTDIQFLYFNKFTKGKFIDSFFD